MPEMQEANVMNLEAAQAAELSLLVDLEARWENLRRNPLRPAEVESSTQHLQGKQKAYESFHAKLVAYNDRHTPAHMLRHRSYTFIRKSSRLLAAISELAQQGENRRRIGLLPFR